MTGPDTITIVVAIRLTAGAGTNMLKIGIADSMNMAEIGAIDSMNRRRSAPSTASRSLEVVRSE